MGKPKLIVVDDEPDMASLIGEVSEQSGFETRIAVSGDEFLVMFTVDPPDVVVLDLVMPEMDGIEILRQLAAIGGRAAIILISGYGGRYLPIANAFGSAKELRIIGTLAKPFSLSEMEVMLRQALSQI